MVWERRRPEQSRWVREAACGKFMACCMQPKAVPEICFYINVVFISERNRETVKLGTKHQDVKPSVKREALRKREARGRYETNTAQEHEYRT